MVVRDTAYKNRLLITLAAILGFNYVDGSVFGLVLQNIKADFSLTDTQLGFLTGFGFTLFYAVMGLRIARWADRGNRVAIITVTTALWSVAVMLCGVAGNFVQLLLIRVGVAVGESGCVPPAHSLIAEYFTRTERPRAVARYMLGGPLSVVVGYFVGGWLNEFCGWRLTFILLGLPGLALAAVAHFSLREPRRAESRRYAGERFTSPVVAEPRITAPPSMHPSLWEVGRTLWGNTTFRHLSICYSVLYFFSGGVSNWQPAYFIRSYGLKTGELGTWFTVIFGLGGFLGTYCGGEWASRRAAGNERLQLNAMAIAQCGFAVSSALMFLSHNKYCAFALLGLATVGVNTFNGPFFATIQSLVPDRMRAMSIALIYLFANLIGMGLGPLAVGALSDGLRPLLGEESLRYALLAMSPGYFWAAWHIFRASGTVARDLQAARTNQNSVMMRGCASSSPSIESPPA
jgi:MFS family permease